jgi:hypothetical protein
MRREPLHFGVRWQAQRDTALGGLGVPVPIPRVAPCESAVAAALCRRTPNGIAEAHQY